MAATDVRPKITLACVECKERNYITKKNRRNNPDRLEMKKHCPRCNAHTAHRAPRNAINQARTRGRPRVIGGGLASFHRPVPASTRRCR